MRTTIVILAAAMSSCTFQAASPTGPNAPTSPETSTATAAGPSSAAPATAVATADGPALASKWIAGWSGQILYLPLQGDRARDVQEVVFRAGGREHVVSGGDVHVVAPDTVAVLAPRDFSQGEVQVAAGGRSAAVPLVVHAARGTVAKPPAIAADEGAPAQADRSCHGIEGRWRGRLAGNDPDVDATLELRVSDDCRNVQGMLLWRSPRSGQSDRMVSGTWDAAGHRVIARDTALALDDPNGGWRFCPIDRYELTLTDRQRLVGTYVSRQCEDNATVNLQRGR